MTVKQLKEMLSHYPDHMDVFLAERTTEFAYGLLNSVTSKEITFSENPGDKVLAKETVIILYEDVPI